MGQVSHFPRGIWGQVSNFPYPITTNMSVYVCCNGVGTIQTKSHSRVLGSGLSFLHPIVHHLLVVGVLGKFFTNDTQLCMQQCGAFKLQV